MDGLARRVAPAVAGGMLVGAVVIGLLSRLAMRVLAITSEHAHGVETDDGFEIGRFTLDGSVSLLIVGLGIGAVVGLLAPSVGALAGRGWWRVVPGAALGATVGGAMLVHDDGIDFVVLEPAWLAVSMFVLIAALIGGAIVPVVDRLAEPGGWFNRLPLAVRMLFVLPVVLPPMFIAAVFTAVVQEAVKTSPRWVVPAGRVVVAAIAVFGGSQLIETTRQVV